MSDPVHVCDLLIESQSCLPKLPPQAKTCDRMLRYYKKFFIPTGAHPLSRTFFRSSSSLLAEKKRYIKHNNWIILHPFSYFNIAREIVIFFVWTIVYVYKPHMYAFMSLADREKTFHYISLPVVDTLLLLNCAMYFVTAYYDPKTKAIELRLRYTIWNYVTTYFVTDLLILPPFNLAVWSKTLTPKTEEFIDRMISFFRIFVYLVRCKTLFNYMRHLTFKVKMSEQTHNMISVVFIGALILHWCTCLLIVMSRSFDQNRAMKDFFNLAGNVPKDVQHYIECFTLVTCHFLRAGTGVMYTSITNMSQFLTLTFIVLISYGYHIYVLVRALQMVVSQNVSETQYEEMNMQLRHYMQSKKTPQDLTRCVLIYFEQRYQYKFFHINSLNDVLSEHLVSEILLARCSHLLKCSPIFKGLTRFNVGRVISFLSPDILLQNEILVRMGETADHMYLISYGTVALYNENGEELCHLEDGDLIWETGDVYKHDIITTEFTELYRMKRKDFIYCIDKVTNFAESLEEIKRDRNLTIQILREQQRLERERSNILIQINKGRILDRLILRWRQMLSSKDIE